MIEIIKGDITKIAVDAIVNAANKQLKGGGGVDGAIHRAGGKTILEQCMLIVEKQGLCPVGGAVITTAGNLPAKYVIHTVGPFWNGKKRDDDLLHAAYTNSLNLAIENGIESISFPNISTGAYRFPKQQAAEIAVNTVRTFLQNPGTIKQVLFVCLGEENLSIYNDLLRS